jgi:hypothetical protein
MRCFNHDMETSVMYDENIFTECPVCQKEARLATQHERDEKALRWVAEKLAALVHILGETSPGENYCSDCPAYDDDPVCDCCQDASPKSDKCVKNLIAYARKQAEGK